jgi:hypothetical protein
MKHIAFAICTAAILFACSPEKKESSASGADAPPSTLVKEEVTVPIDTVKFPTPGEFHKMLARSNGTWIGKGTVWFSPDAPPVDGGTSMLINKMAMGGLYQISEIKGTLSKGKPWTGLRITGYDHDRKVFTRAMIGDGISTGGVAMEGIWDEATKSITMPFKKFDPSTGKERNLKEVYKIVDENTEVLEIYATDPKTKKEFKIVNVEWTRN